VLQAFGDKITSASDRFNRSLLEVGQLVGQQGVTQDQVNAALEAVRVRNRELVRASVNHALHRGKVSRVRGAVAFHEGHVDEVYGEIRDLL
jgi:hypothetical protein